MQTDAEYDLMVTISDGDGCQKNLTQTLQTQILDEMLLAKTQAP